MIDTEYGKHTVLPEIPTAIKFLVKELSVISISERDIQTITSLKPLSITYMSDLYHRLLKTNGCSPLFLFDSSSSTANPAAILTIPSFTINGSLIQPSPPGVLQKMWVNTAFYGNTKHDGLAIKNIYGFMAYVVRAFLCGSFDKCKNNNTKWLMPADLAFMADSYSMAISQFLERTYNLNYTDTQFIRILFAYFFIKQLPGLDTDKKYPSLLSQLSMVGNMTQVMQALDVFYQEFDYTQPLSITTFLTALSKVAPQRMHSLSWSKFLALFANSSLHHQLLSIAAEYPPYWAYLILQHMSGERVSILYSLFKISSFKQRSIKWASSISKYSFKLTRR